MSEKTIEQTVDNSIEKINNLFELYQEEKAKNESLNSQLAVKEESYKVEKDKHQKLIEFIISKISPLISFVDNSEEAARQAILDLISKQDTLAKEIKDTKDQAEKKEQELVKKNETLQGQLDVLQKQFDTLKKKYDQDIEIMQDRIDSVQAQLEENNDAKEENGKFLTWIKNLIEKITKG